MKMRFKPIVFFDPRRERKTSEGDSNWAEASCGRSDEYSNLFPRRFSFHNDGEEGALYLILYLAALGGENDRAKRDGQSRGCIIRLNPSSR